MTISVRDLEEDLYGILDRVRRIRPSDERNPHWFHEDKGTAAEMLLKLIDRVKGNARKPEAANSKADGIRTWRA